MRVQYSHLGLWVSLALLLATFSFADKNKVEVIGFAECVDCKESNIKTSHALSGLRVSIDCKADKGEFQTRGVGELDEEGKFEVSLPEDILQDEKLGEECYAQLHSAALAACPAHNGLENSKIIFHSKSEKTHTFAPIGKLKISTVLCTSAFLWPRYKYPHLPKLPPLDKWKKPFPKLTIPPLKKKFGHSFPPLHKKPLPPLPPLHKKPLLPPVPVYKKPLPPAIPIYKKPLPPPVPIYKPTPTIVKPKPTVPIYKKPLTPVLKPHPIYEKPLPPFYKPLPSISKKKPCPPIKIPHIPKIIPKYHHPKFGSFPPIFPHP